jgi:hypothetical protein
MPWKIYKENSSEIVSIVRRFEEQIGEFNQCMYSGAIVRTSKLIGISKLVEMIIKKLTYK